MNVTLPDGTVVNNVPEGTTKMQLAQKLQTSGHHVPSEWLTPTPAPSAPPEGAMGVLKDVGSAVARPLAKGLAGVPLMAADAGVGAGNWLSENLAGTVPGIRPLKYAKPMELPSETFNKALDSVTRKPTGAGKIAEEVSSSLVGVPGMPKVPKAAGAAASKAVNSKVKLLADKGVTMTPGQRRGGAINRLEQGTTRIPVLGDFVKNARSQSVEQFHRATLDDALKPIGATVPKDLKGHAAVGEVQRQLSARYDAILPKLTGSLNGPTGLASEINKLRATATQKLPAQQAADFNRFVKDEVFAKFKGGKIDGEALKNVHTTLDNEINEFQNSTSPYDRKLSQSLSQVRDLIHKMVSQENPQYSTELDAVDAGWAKFKVAQKAATSPGARKDGVFTPAQYMSAVGAKDASKDKSRLARGAALQQDVAGAGQEVLGNTLPDSGTPYGLMEQNLMSLKGIGMLAASPVMGAAYSQPVLKYLQNRALRANPKDREALKKLLLSLGVQTGSGVGQDAGAAQ